MRRALILCTVILAGCAPSQQPASESTSEHAVATVSLADMAGIWSGTVMAAGSDTALANIEVTATPDPTGWTMRVSNAKDPSWSQMVPATSVVAEGDSVIVEAGPFPSVLRAGQQVTTYTVYRLQNGQLLGTHRATYPESGETVMLRSVATRKAG